VRAGSRHHQVADACEARSGRGFTTEREHEAHELAETARDQKSLGTVAELELIRHARADGDDVLERAA